MKYPFVQVDRCMLAIVLHGEARIKMISSILLNFNPIGYYLLGVYSLTHLQKKCFFYLPCLN